MRDGSRSISIQWSVKLAKLDHFLMDGIKLGLLSVIACRFELHLKVFYPLGIFDVKS
jgi:hypothetical protein